MPKTLRQRILYVLVGTVYGLIVFVAVTIALIPTISQYAYRHWLEQQHLQGEIGHIGLALSSGTLTLLHARISDGEHTLLSLGKLQIRIRLRDLFDHKLTIEHVELANTRLQLRQNADSFVVAGIKTGQAEAAPPPPVTEPQAGGQPWTIDLHKLQISNLDTCLHTTKMSQPLGLCNHLGSFDWQGKVDLSTMDPLSLKATGGIAIGDLSLLKQGKEVPLAQLASLTLTGLQVDSLDRIKFDKLAMQQLKMLPASDAGTNNLLALGIDKLLVDSISLKKMTDLDIAAINIENLSTHILLNADNTVVPVNELTGLRPVEKKTPAVKNKAPTTPTKQNAFRFRLGKLTVNNTKSLVLEDAHTKPAVTHSIDNFSFSLENLDSSQPRQASALTTQFKYGEYGKIEVNGTVQAFAAKPSMNLKSTILGLNLNRVSPYLRKLLQHRVKSGQLNAKLTIKIDQGKLDSDAKLTLNKFYVVKLSGKQTDKYQKSLGLPLSSALSLLRDRSDAIKIDLPVSGDVEHPDFSLNDIISTVSVKAIKAAVINYYASLGLLSLIRGAYDLATALRFDPVGFAPGQSALNDTSLALLDKFATMLHDRPQVHLVVCGHAGIADQLKLFPTKQPSTGDTQPPPDKKAPPLSKPQLQQLNILAQARSDVIKQYLVQKKQVAADRLILCNPEYDAADTHSPYAELHI